MPYLVNRQGTYWFQIRVPAPLVDRFGQFIRQNLQTPDRGVAQSIAYRLASHWLERFASLRSGLDTLSLIPAAITAPGPTGPVGPLHPVHEIAALDTQHPPVGTAILSSLDHLYHYWRKLNPHCAKSTYLEVQSVVKDFQKVVRRCPPADLVRPDITLYRDKLIARKLARATVSKKISFISTLLQTAVDASLMPHNVAKGIRIPKRKVSMVSRRAFTHEELEKIFSSPVYKQHRRYAAGGGDAAVWVPLLALATGARLEEICQLRVTDIVVDDQHGPLMHIRDQEEDQHVKTASSRRTIPIHPKLIDAGFVSYCNQMQWHRQARLFPELELDHDGRYGGNFSKWFSRYLRSANGCNIKDKHVVFHSFRHAFKTLCREMGLHEEVHDALTGHVSSGVGRSYGHVPIATLVEAVHRINFPISFPVICLQENP